MAFLNQTLDADTTCFDLIPLIRAQNPRCHILIVAGDADRETLIRALNFGVSGFLEKSLIEDKLNQKLPELGWLNLKVIFGTVGMPQKTLWTHIYIT